MATSSYIFSAKVQFIVETYQTFKTIYRLM